LCFESETLKFNFAHQHFGMKNKKKIQSTKQNLMAPESFENMKPQPFSPSFF